MTIGLATFRAQVDYLIDADSDIISEAARDEMVEAAMERYSRDRPDTQTDDVDGDGGRYYGIEASLSGWVEGFSRIDEIEYPAATVASDETPVYLEPEDWRDDYWADASGTQTRYLYLPSHAPAATEAMRITYTIPFTYSTMPAQDFFAVCYLAAGIICQALAAKFARSSDSTIAADSVRHMTRSSEHARRAKEFIALYEEHLGLGEEADTKAAGEFVDWDTAPGWPAGREFMHHGRDVR